MRRGQKRTLSNLTAGAIGIALLIVIAYFGFTKAIPFQHHYTIKAAFHSANNLKPNSPVRIAGVNVGKVTDVTPLGTGQNEGATVTMQIEDQGLPIHTNASASIRPRIFLEGNFFVDVNPGSPGAPKLGDGDTIAIQNNRAPVQLDQILSALQGDTRANLQTLLVEYATALNGPGATGFNRSIPYWKPAYRDLSQVNQALLGENAGDLQGFIKDAGSTAQALDANPPLLQSLISDFNTTARAFATQQAALERTIALLPGTLRAARPALASLNASFPPVRALVSDLRPAVRSSGPAIDAATPFVTQVRRLVSKPELRGLTKDLVPTVPALARLNVASVPLFGQVRAASSCQNKVVLPWTKLKISDPNFPATGNVFQEAPKPFPGLAGEGRSSSANGYWFRVLVNSGNYTYNLGNNEFASAAFPFLGSNPTKANSRPPLRSDVPCETQPVPNLDTNVGAAPQQVQSAATANPGAYAKEWSKLSASALTELRAALKRSGLEKLVPVSDKQLTLAEIQQLASQLGHSAQLGSVTQLLQGTPLSKALQALGGQK